MTNKEELKKRFYYRFVNGTGHIQTGLDSNGKPEADYIFAFFWNEIEKIRKEDMDKMVEDINKLNTVVLSPNTIIEEKLISKHQVLSIIKQSNE